MNSSTSNEIAYLVFDSGYNEIGYLIPWDDPSWSDRYSFYMYDSSQASDRLQVDGVELDTVAAIFDVRPK